MTKETRFLFELQDVAQIRATCACCQSEVLCRLDSEFSLPAKCPNCKSVWYTGHGTPGYNLIQNMRQLIRQSDPLVTLRFEVLAPTETD